MSREKCTRYKIFSPFHQITCGSGDIAMILAEQQLDEARIAAFLVQKASARNIQVSKRAFREDEIRSRARENYADLQATVRKAFIPFEEAFSKIVGFTERLNIPD